jgi:hypothetical protein
MSCFILRSASPLVCLTFAAAERARVEADRRASARLRAIERGRLAVAGLTREARPS